MKRNRTFIAFALLISLLFTMIAGCGNNSNEKKEESETSDAISTNPEEKEKSPKKEIANRSKELTIYAALPESELPEYMNAFEQETGIKVNYVRLSAGEILAKLQAEGNNPGASLWLGVQVIRL